MMYRYIDVHCHPNLDGLKSEQESVIADMKEHGVLGIVVGTNLESSREAVRLAEKHEHLFATVGLHPNYTLKEKFDEAAFEELLQHPKVVGVGECGIDYFRQSTTAHEDEIEKGWKEKQWEVFEKHISLAVTYNKPLMVHCRPSKKSVDAYEEVASYFESLKGEAKDRLRGNMHFFVGNVAVAKRFWALDFTTSFTGVLTFTRDYDDVVREAPLSMLLTETDAPYAAPVPHRGEVNKPVYVTYVTQAIAALKNLPEHEAQEAILQNAIALFGLEIEP